MPGENKLLLFGTDDIKWNSTPQYLINGGMYIYINDEYQEIPIGVFDETHTVDIAVLEKYLSMRRTCECINLTYSGNGLEKYRHWLMSVP